MVCILYNQWISNDRTTIHNIDLAVTNNLKSYLEMKVVVNEICTLCLKSLVYSSF